MSHVFVRLVVAVVVVEPNWTSPKTLTQNNMGICVQSGAAPDVAPFTHLHVGPGSSLEDSTFSLSSYRTRGCPTPTTVQPTTPICRSHPNPNLLFSLRQKGGMSCDITASGTKLSWYFGVISAKGRQLACLHRWLTWMSMYFSPKWVRIIKHLSR